MAPTPQAVPSPTPNPAATARYRVTFDASWSSASHPTDIPRNPHFSRLIGGTHKSTVKFWESGALASEGIRLMAEQGRTTPLDTEVEAAIAAGQAQRVLVGDGIDRSPDRVVLDFEISRDFSLVTLVSMLAPSPDWFVGVSGLNLDLGQDASRGRGNFRVYLVGGNFKERLVALDLVANLLEPLGDGALEDGLAHLRHHDIGWHISTHRVIE